MSKLTTSKLSTFALTLLITSAIDSIRNLPATALFGTSLIFFFIFAAIVFLLPTALVSAELSANIEEGGIYEWSRRAFGERFGFLAVWLQWTSNIAYFPTILSFIAGTACYLIDPSLAQNKLYLVSVILGSFWLLTFINLKGIRLSARVTGICTIVGLIIPMLLIITLFVIWLVMGHPVQLHLTASNMLPDLHKSDNWIALTAIMLGFAGMELATVHVNDVKDPQKTFPRALAFSTLIILITMMLGSLAIAFVLPYKDINLVDGTMQTFAYFFAAYHLHWVTPIITVLLLIGSYGSIVSWVISPVKGLAQAGAHGFMPPFLYQTNEHGVPQNLLIAQAILVSIGCLAFLFIPSVNGSYWLLTALTAQLYMLMYILMFCAAIKLRYNMAHQPSCFCIPGKKCGSYIVSALGLIGCLITLAVGFIPPSNMNIGGSWHYEMVFMTGMLLLILPILIFYVYHRINQRSDDDVKGAPALVNVDN